MKLFCVVDPALNPPSGWPSGAVAHWTACPSNPALLVVRVDIGDNYSTEALWRAMPGIDVLFEGFGWHEPIGPQHAAYFAPLGVNPGDTISHAARKIRAVWPYFHS